MRIIISGGGTGGHIFPALAIANAIKARHPEAEILFVGAKGRMEMEKVPAAGYTIKGLPIAGLQRQITLHNILLNLLLPFKVLASRCKVRSILRSFKPDVVVGVGGFASQPTLSVAARMGYTTLLQEQNSYAGLANKTLARNAARICVAYPDMERFFPADKIVFTGNPVRQDIENLGVDRAQGCSHFGLDPERPVILVVGGSLGARSINCMMMDGLGLFPQSQVQVIWQTGRLMQQQAREAVASGGGRHLGRIRQLRVHHRAPAATCRRQPRMGHGRVHERNRGAGVRRGHPAQDGHRDAGAHRCHGVQGIGRGGGRNRAPPRFGRDGRRRLLAMDGGFGGCGGD